MGARIREHLHFIIVITVLTLVMTFPTIVYVFRTDVFWLPEGGNPDVLANLWDVWYGKQILTGKADRLYTNLIFYPDGVSLAYHPFFFIRMVLMNVLHLWMPISNAFSVTFLLIIISSALAAYFYVLWFFKDRWLALFGAIIFGFSPQVIGYPGWPAIAWIAPMPVIIYCAHRGIGEKRVSLIILAGVFTGLTTEVMMYIFVCALITVGLFVSALSASRWREKEFWLHVVLLIAVCTLSCAWRVIPMLQDDEQLGRAEVYAGNTRSTGDLISFVVNTENPILGPLAETVFQIPENAKISQKAYLGLIPLTLIGVGLLSKGVRRKMLPWLVLILVFLVLCLGSTLSINGTLFERIKLPKYYLDQLLPFISAAFYRINFFITGARLPLAILSCFGLAALRDRVPFVARPGFILVLIAIVAFEYYSPIEVDSRDAAWSDDVTEERLAYLDWLEQDEEREIRLINVPFGIHNARRYSFFQSLGGYPQTDGAISRTPSSAYNYVRENRLLNAWYSQRPIHCETTEHGAYLAALEALEADGFSHIVYHRVFYGAAKIAESFDGVQPSYSDGFVSIYRLSDLRDSCPAELSARHFFSLAYADALGKAAALEDRHGVAVILAPTSRIADHFTRYLRHARKLDKSVAVISSDERGEIEIRSTASVDLESKSTVWLVKDRLEFVPEPTEANYSWFLARYRFCERFLQDEHTTVDLYLQLDIPCHAMDDGSAIGVHYDEGVRLHNASFKVFSDEVRFYLAWSNETANRYAFSIQFFGEDGERALQFDELIRRDLLSVYKIDTTPLQGGAYSVQLIVYDFETQISQGGTLTETTHRFERELELAKIELET